MRAAWILSVYIHILAAAFWIGGMIFLVVVLLPSIRNHPDKAKLLHISGLKFRTWGWIALILLFISGIIQLNIRGAELRWSWFMESNFGWIAFWKILTFALIIVLSLVHDFYVGIRATKLWMEDPENPEVQKFRKASRFFGRINLMLALIAAFLGVLLVRGLP